MVIQKKLNLLLTRGNNMDNKELYNKFYEIASLNIFDAVIELKKFKKEYKKSDFYKSTKLSLIRAYEIFNKSGINEFLYTLRTLTDTDKIINKLTDILNGIESDTIQDFFDKIVEVLNIDELNEHKGELTGLLNQLKNFGS